MERLPERDANQLLEEAWPSDERGPVIAVDPIAIAHKLGIDVYTARMEGAFSGAIEKLPGADPVIYLNADDARNRQRFTCAHELGHYYQRTLDGSAEYSFTDRRDGLAATGTDPSEIYANRFGAALLMPSVAVARLHRQLDVVELALRFGVSEEAMRFRLKNLGLR